MPPVWRLDRDGWLEGPGVERAPSPRHYALFVERPIGLVWHHTAGPAGRSGYADALARNIQRPKSTSDTASWHVLGTRDGRLLQSVPLTLGAWHVRGFAEIGGQKLKINRHLLGFELENEGELRRLDGRLYRWPYYRRDPRYPGGLGVDERCRIPEERGVRLDEPGWAGWYASYAPVQELLAIAFLRACVPAFGWQSGQCVYGHGHFEPRKQKEPGLWLLRHLPGVLETVFGLSAEGVIA